MTKPAIVRGALPDSDPLPLREFARRAGIGVYTARSWCKCGRVRATRGANGRWLVPHSALAHLPMTVTAFAAATGINRRTVVRLCEAGRLKCWRRPVAYRIDDGEARRTAWEIDSGEVRRVRSETPGSFDAIRESRQILESRALRESRQILEISKAKRAAKKVEDEKFYGPIKATKSRARTKIPRKRGGQ